MPELIIRGLPSSLANDAWWLSETTEPRKQDREAIEPTLDHSHVAPRGILGLILMIVLADFLFWEHPVGISLVLFSLGLSIVAFLNLQPNFSRREWSTVALGWVLSALPVIEYVQLVSVLFLVIGHCALLIWCAIRSNVRSLVQAILYLPVTLFSFAAACSVNLGMRLFRGKEHVTQSGMLALVLPLSVGMVFFWLFVGANPLFQQWVNDFFRLDISPDVFARFAFWIMTGFMVFPFVLFKGFTPYLVPKARASKITVKPQSNLINVLSIRNSLLLFNVMFAFQNVTDLTILWSGLGLPEGMTYATYAHSGAYPLMATSILAGLFAIVSRQFTYGSDFIKMLLLVWIAQNIILLISAFIRLELYVSSYGLTYLRLRAGIGMGMVIVGMALLIWQLWKSKSNAWLTGSFSAVTICVFYLCSFVNFGYVIAAENLSRDDRAPDVYYLCSQAPNGIQALVDELDITRATPCLRKFERTTFQADNWRDWSRRGAHMETYRQIYLDAFDTSLSKNLKQSQGQVRDR